VAADPDVDDATRADQPADEAHRRAEADSGSSTVNSLSVIFPAHPARSCRRSWTAPSGSTPTRCPAWWPSRSLTVGPTTSAESWSRPNSLPETSCEQLSWREPRSPTTPRVEGSGWTVLVCPTPSRRCPTNQAETRVRPSASRVARS
jgi:hypothetical protein